MLTRLNKVHPALKICRLFCNNSSRRRTGRLEEDIVADMRVWLRPCRSCISSGRERSDGRPIAIIGQCSWLRFSGNERYNEMHV
jgi:hypothetical protein